MFCFFVSKSLIRKPSDVCIGRKGWVGGWGGLEGRGLMVADASTEENVADAIMSGQLDRNSFPF